MEQMDILEQTTNEHDFALARCAFLDRFADIEALICRILSQDGSLPASREPFGNRLKIFAQVSKPNLIAKCRIGHRNSIVDAISKILPIRADLVHSRMHVAKLDSVPVALFINSQLAHDPDAPARILSLERIKQLTASLDKQAKAIETLKKPVNQASSPPPPSPGEAGDP